MPNVAVVFGSGGHTGEMDRIIERESLVISHIVVGSSDSLSLSLIKDKYAEKRVIIIPRPRKVLESYFKSVLGTLVCLFIYIKKRLSMKETIDLLLCNGPAISLVCIVGEWIIWILSLGLKRRTRIVYVESIARVKRLSLTGRILENLYLTDMFIVQWKGLQSAKRSYNGIYF